MCAHGSRSTARRDVLHAVQQTLHAQQKRLLDSRSADAAIVHHGGAGALMKGCPAACTAPGAHPQTHQGAAIHPQPSTQLQRRSLLHVAAGQSCSPSRHSGPPRVQRCSPRHHKLAKITLPVRARDCTQQLPKMLTEQGPDPPVTWPLGSPAARTATGGHPVPAVHCASTPSWRSPSTRS